MEDRDQEHLYHLERCQLSFPGSSCENCLIQRINTMATSTQNILEYSHGYCHCQLLVGVSPRSAIGTIGVGSMTWRLLLM